LVQIRVLYGSVLKTKIYIEITAFFIINQELQEWEIQNQIKNNRNITYLFFLMF